MADLELPDDPYDLVQGHWPAESEGSYHILEQQMNALHGVALGEGENSTADAAEVGQDFLGQTGSAVSTKLDALGRSLDDAAGIARGFAMQMLSAAESISSAKKSIRRTVRTANPQIADAKAEEAEGQSPEPSSDTLISNARSAIQTTMDGYNADMADVTTALNAAEGPSVPDAPPPPAPRAWRGPNRETAYTHEVAPGHREQIQQSGQYPAAVQHQPQPGQPGQPGQPNIAGHPGFTHPGHHGGVSSPSASGAPSAPTPSMSNPAGGLGSNSGLGGPGSGQLGGNSGLGGPGTGLPGTGQPGQSGVPSGTPASGDPSSPGLLGSPMLDAAASAAASAASGLTMPVVPIAPVVEGPIAAAGSAAAAGGTPPPMYPTSTGATPGSAAAPGGFTPLTPGGVGAVSPVSPATPGVPATPPTGSPATPPTAAPTPGGQVAPSPGGPGTERVGPQGAAMNAVVAQHLQQAGAKTAADAGAPFVTPAEAEERSFVQALPADEARAHMTLASLRRSFDETGWSQPLAVAVVRQGETEAVFYATADGLSVWPTGVSLPENVFPLGYLRPVSEDAAWLGYADPSEKLGGLPGTQLILTTEAVALTPDAENSHPVQTQTPSQYREIARCRDTLPAHTTRGADLRDGDVDALLARVLAAHPAVSSPEDAATALRQARWYDRQPAGYVAAYMDYLVSEAVAARDAGDTGGAVYLASQAAELLNLPSGEEVP